LPRRSRAPRRRRPQLSDRAGGSGIVEQRYGVRQDETHRLERHVGDPRPEVGERPVDHGHSRRLGFFPGSTIGNFEPAEAADFLRLIANIVGTGGGLLIGVDLQKDPAILHAAYNDSAGITAQFNLNLLVRANRELDANFDLSRWRHRAIYNAPKGRIEMRLISTANQSVRIGEQEFHFALDEEIITEFSYKYTPEGFTELAAAANFRFRQIWTDDAQLFGVFYLTVAT
jgi:dimethylhistidine N-methyltransferase